MISFKRILLKNIIPPEHDARIHTDIDADQELAESVRTLGVLLPLIVRKKNNDFEIIAGNRRFRAADKVGLPSVPCIISQVGDEEADKIKLHENIKRLPLSHIEQATTFLYLRSKYGHTEAQISELVGKSVPYISQHLGLIDSDPELITAVHMGTLTFSVAREIMTLKNPDDRKQIRKWAEDGGASVDIVKNWVNEAKNHPPPPAHGVDRTPLDLPPQHRTLPVFECRACEQPTPINEMRVIRICPTCEHAIFSEIEAEKKKIAFNSNEVTQG